MAETGCKIQRRHLQGSDLEIIIYSEGTPCLGVSFFIHELHESVKSRTWLHELSGNILMRPLSV